MTWSAVFISCFFLQSAVWSRPLDQTVATSSQNRRPFAVVSPINGHTKLQLEEEGLEIIRNLEGPFSPVVVIGPYRSGKSFLLNQVLGVGCDEGFGVGHTRKTQTKGVWMWGEPLVVARGEGQKPLNLLLFDTEGFEATGKADAYDDRIFALSTVLSAVLIYNLPETVRESDVQALSFAVQLADTFYTSAQTREGSSLEAANMLWLIQRDFLQGTSVQQMVNAALEPVDNPNKDGDIEEVNRIRLSLKSIAKNSTAFGLRQPHLERTRLCELEESELEQTYVQQRNDLRQLINGLSKPKLINGAEITGPELAKLIEKMVAALNSREIPTAGSILEHFNKDLIQKVSEEYASVLEARPLPVEMSDLEAYHQNISREALERFDMEKFGTESSASSGSLRGMLERKLDQTYERRKTANALTSGVECQEIGGRCEDEMERQQHASLPSIGRFEAKYRLCREQFETRCLGPGRSKAQERLEKAWARESKRFRSDYNSKLFNGLELVMLVDIVVFRFFLRNSALETVGWLGFFFLQVYPKLFLASGSMFDSSWWQVLARCWESVVYNPIVDLQHTWQLLLLFVALVVALWRIWKSCWNYRWYRRKDKRHRLAGTDNLRDLEV